MKGVSPFIATVLIIAFTVAVGGIISIWLTTFSTTTTTTVGTSAEKEIKCIASSLAVKEVKYTSGGDFANITLTYERGTENLHNLTIDVYGGGRTNSSNASYTTTADPFEPGESYVVSINTSGGATLPPEYVRARAICQSVITIVGECKAGDPCMKSV